MYFVLWVSTVVRVPAVREFFYNITIIIAFISLCFSHFSRAQDVKLYPSFWAPPGAVTVSKSTRLFSTPLPSSLIIVIITSFSADTINLLFHWPLLIVTNKTISCTDYIVLRTSRYKIAVISSTFFEHFSGCTSQMICYRIIKNSVERGNIWRPVVSSKFNDVKKQKTTCV